MKGQVGTLVAAVTLCLVTVACAQPLSVVEYENRYDLPVVILPSNTGLTWQEALERQKATPNKPVTLEAGSKLTMPSGTLGGTDRHCAPELAVVYFLQPNSNGAVGPEEPISDDDFGVENFDLAFTLGPGYCFDSRTDSTYVIGDDFDRL